MRIRMFTKTVCSTCKIAKQQLAYVPVPVEIEEINIEENPMIEALDGGSFRAHDYLTNILDSMSTPTFEFEDGTIVRGFEMGQIQEALGL